MVVTNYADCLSWIVLHDMDVRIRLGGGPGEVSVLRGSLDKNPPSSTSAKG
jgi:hypothetical protein